MNATPETITCEVAISGGGMVGFTLALLLAKAGLEVAVVERDRPETQTLPPFDGRASAIALGSRRILEQAGAWEAMEPHAEPIRDIRVVDGDSPLFVHYDHSELGTEPLGHIVENRFIRKALLEACERQPCLRLIAPASVTRFAQDTGSATLTLSDGTALRAPLAIAAEGRNSALRGMADIPTKSWDYEQTAIVCTVKPERHHGGVAVERFLPTGPFAMLPMTEGRVSLVWVEPPAMAKHLLALPEAEFLEQLSRRFGDWLGELAVEGQRFSYPLSLLHARRYTAPRLALAGDVAHAIHPLAGQGVNLGFRDVAALAELVVDTRRLGLDIGSRRVLEAYEQWRAFDAFTLIAVTDGLNKLFSNRFPPIAAARQLGLAAVNHLPPLKKFFMRHAMGLTGRLPRLMQGNPL